VSQVSQHLPRYGARTGGGQIVEYSWGSRVFFVRAHLKLPSSLRQLFYWRDPSGHLLSLAKVEQPPTRNRTRTTPKLTGVPTPIKTAPPFYCDRVHCHPCCHESRSLVALASTHCESVRRPVEDTDSARVDPVPPPCHPPCLLAFLRLRLQTCPSLLHF
jgi:hypothetical protein